MNFALVKSLKRVLKSTTILGCDVSEENNVNLFFQALFWTFLTAVYARVTFANIGYKVSSSICSVFCTI